MAVRGRDPAVVSVTVHWPVATVAVHVLVPALTVTLPVGVPAPGTLTETLYCTVTAWPTFDGSGASEVIVLVVLARLTWCETTAETGLAL